MLLQMHYPDWNYSQIALLIHAALPTAVALQECMALTNVNDEPPEDSYPPDIYQQLAKLLYLNS